MPLEVRPVASRRELTTFIKLPWRLYRNERNTLLGAAASWMRARGRDGGDGGKIVRTYRVLEKTL